jgi:hypothetical protein
MAHAEEMTLALRANYMSYHDLELRSAVLDGGRWRRSEESAGKDQERIAEPG